MHDDQTAMQEVMVSETGERQVHPNGTTTVLPDHSFHKTSPLGNGATQMERTHPYLVPNYYTLLCG